MSRWLHAGFTHENSSGIDLRYFKNILRFKFLAYLYFLNNIILEFYIKVILNQSLRILFIIQK